VTTRCGPNSRCRAQKKKRRRSLRREVALVLSFRMMSQERCPKAGLRLHFRRRSRFSSATVRMRRPSAPTAYSDRSASVRPSWGGNRIFSCLSSVTTRCEACGRTRGVLLQDPSCSYRSRTVRVRGGVGALGHALRTVGGTEETLRRRKSGESETESERQAR